MTFYFKLRKNKPLIAPLLLKIYPKLKNKNRKGLFLCRMCEDNKEFVADISKVNLGHTKSCGCYRRFNTSKLNYKHGYASNNAKTLNTFKIWYCMLQRCYNPSRGGYEDYGGRGIKVSKPWKTFKNFLRDMGIRPEGLSIERIDNYGDYCKENCRWATPKEQAYNRRDNIVTTYDNKLVDIYKESKSSLSYYVVVNRVKHGWPIDLALEAPVGSKLKDLL